MRCGWLAGLRVSAGDVGQQLRWPRRHGTHGDGSDRGRQRRAAVGLYCLSRVVSRARCLQAAAQATAPQFVQFGSATSCPWMIQSGGRRLLLLDPPRMIQSGASGLSLPDDALVVLRPLLLVLPRMIES